MSDIKSLQDAKATLEFMIEVCSELEGPDTILLQSLVDAEITRTAAPRFTAEEREAVQAILIHAVGSYNIFVESLKTATEINAHERDRVNFLNAIATVRKMLEGAE